jgi:hypothetical protein
MTEKYIQRGKSVNGREEMILLKIKGKVGRKHMGL